ncbi:MAG: DoxX family protein [Adhaeribacter sp.]
MKVFHRHYPRLSFGLLLLRLGLGLSFMAHGGAKLAGGPEGWLGLGGAMAHWGITFAPVFWGFAGAMAEFGGGLLVVLGLFFRPVCLVLVFTMATATLVHLKNGDDYSTLSHALEMGLVFGSLFFTGPGAYSLDYRLAKKDYPKSIPS